MKNNGVLNISVYKALELACRGGISTRMKLKIAARLEREGTFVYLVNKLRADVKADNAKYYSNNKGRWYCESI